MGHWLKHHEQLDSHHEQKVAFSHDQKRILENFFLAEGHWIKKWSQFLISGLNASGEVEFIMGFTPKEVKKFEVGGLIKTIKVCE